MKLTPEQRKIVSDIRHRIADSKRKNTRRNFIGWSGCLQVCDDMLDVLDVADGYMQSGEYLLAYTISSVVLINAARLAITADDSGGGVTEVEYAVINFLDELCSIAAVETDAEIADAIVKQSCKDSMNKAFNGLENFAYDILLRTSRLASPGNVKNIFDALEQRASTIPDTPYGYYKEEECMVRIAAVKASEGQEAADEIINSNLNYPGVRKLAVERSMADGNYDRAEALCKGAVSADGHLRGEWAELLISIYEKTDNINKAIDVAYDQLMSEHQIEYYDILKRLYQTAGIWEHEYPALLNQISEMFTAYIYMDILSKEGEDELLMGQVAKHPETVFDYIDELCGKYPKQIYKACCSAIRKEAELAHERGKYRHVCSLIRKLAEHGGREEAFSMIEELRETNPRKPAFQDELDNCEFRLNNPGRIRRRR